MRRLLLLLASLAGTVTLVSGSALAAPARVAASPPTNSALPTISGSAQEGQTLTASSGTWGGTAPITYAYQWQRCSSSGTHCNTIGGASHQNYVASNGDSGNTIRVEVTATNTDGSNQALSAPSASIARAGSAPVSTRQPNPPSGTVQDGQTLTADDGGWSGLAPISYSYQWQSCTSPNPICTNLVGATGSHYLIGTSQIGTQLRATVTATNSLGASSSSSNLSSVVLAKAAAPVNSALPLISGSLKVGERVQASTGTWTGLGTAGFTYQWTRCDANGSACSGILGATGQSYGVGQVDLGMSLRVSVSVANTVGSTTATSAAATIARAVVLTTKLNAVLRPGQVVSQMMNGMHRGAAGHLTGRLVGRSLSWTLTFTRLTGRPTAITLNKGPRGMNGVAVKTLCRRCSSPDQGTLTLTASQADAVRRGVAYVIVRTPRNPAGEIRGQIIVVG